MYAGKEAGSVRGPGSVWATSGMNFKKVGIISVVQEHYYVMMEDVAYE